MSTTSISHNPLHGLPARGLVAEYQRRDLAQLADQHLVELAAEVLGVPRAEIAVDQSSLVLHAPLELMARSALLPYVAPGDRERARLRIVSLAAMYQASGPPPPAPPERAFDSSSDAAATLVGAIDREDLAAVDAAGAWLGPRVRPDQLVALLADHTVDRLSAAGHANIFLALLARNQPRGLRQQMLRHPARELAKQSSRRIAVPSTRTSSDRKRAFYLLDTLLQVPLIGPSEQRGTAAMVEHAQTKGALGGLVDADGTFTAPQVPPIELLRFAAHAMLQGPPESAPYGWTHCLTLPQAALTVAPACEDSSRAIYVASAYLAAHWATLGRGALALDWIPEPVDESVDASLQTSPEDAAAAAWHSTSHADTLTTLATSAALAHDAHRVKYTLACLDAAAADRSHMPLYLAAAAYLNAWWIQHPDRSDPMIDELT